MHFTHYYASLNKLSGSLHQGTKITHLHVQHTLMVSEMIGNESAKLSTIRVPCTIFKIRPSSIKYIHVKT